MSEQSSPADEAMAFPPFTKAEHIQQLNEIDKLIAKLLESAGQALKILSSTQNPGNLSVEERKKAFEIASEEYLRILQTVDVGLKRQIMGLEEADIITPDRIRKTLMDTKMPTMFGGLQAAAPVIESVVEGRMGKLDIGRLNSNSGRVGRDMEAELWEKSRAFLEELQESREKEGGDDVHMND